MPLRMRNDNVLIEYEKPPERIEGSILFRPDMGPRKPTTLYPARVLAVGPGFWAEVSLRPEREEQRGELKAPKVVKKFVPTELHEGARVLVEGLAGDTVRGARSHGRRIVRESEIFAEVGEGVRIDG